MTILDDTMLHRFTRAEYHQMAELGLFGDRRVELLEGRILDMAPQNEPHVAAVSNLMTFLVTHVPKTYQVRCQAPVGAAEDSEPEPDFAVIPASKGRRKDHPRTAILVIEVSDSTLLRDRAKASIYAAAGVHEYWIVNVQARVIEQYTVPARAEGDPARFESRKILKETAAVHCTVLPLPPLPVRECLLWV